VGTGVSRLGVPPSDILPFEFWNAAQCRAMCDWLERHGVNPNMVPVYGVFERGGFEADPALDSGDPAWLIPEYVPGPDGRPFIDPASPASNAEPRTIVRRVRYTGSEPPWPRIS
jgi:hypothetical protein